MNSQEAFETIDPKAEKLKRWRLMLGKDADQALGEIPLDKIEGGMDKSLTALYESERKGGLGASSPNVSRWLGDIRTYFPTSVVKVMQQDALDRLNLTQMLLEPELLESVVPDVNLVANLLTLSKVIPEKTKSTAREVVRKVVEELMKKLQTPMQQAIVGALNRATRNRRPRHNEINWHQTILKNLKHYQPDYQTIIPEVRIGFGKKRRAMKDVILCVDQSGSMATSVVYSGIFGAVMASLPAIRTRMIVFDTEVVDLTDELEDPVDFLFGVQLGGGTDIAKALTYTETHISRPTETILVLITDLFEGGNELEMKKKMQQLTDAGVQMICLLALDDQGTPSYDNRNAAFLASIGVPSFACTPDLFPDLMAAAISKQDLRQWAAVHEVKVV
jgi:Mg-chelatase subunit ChlD